MKMVTPETTDATAPEAEPGLAYRGTLGTRLRAARDASGLTLAEISARTRVPERMLSAIEHDAHDALPHPTFTAGFVRSFAREVGLSEEEAQTRFRAENTRAAPVPMPVPLRIIEPERVPSRGVAIGGLALAAVIVVGGIVYWTTRDRGAEAPAPVMAASTSSVTTPPVAVATVPSGASPATVPSAMPVSTGAAPAVISPAGGVTLTATQDAWIQIRDRATHTRVMSGVLAQGKVYTVPAGDMTLWTGRAGALEVRVGGRLLAPFGGPAETIKDVSLSPAALAQRPAANAAAIAPTG